MLGYRRIELPDIRCRNFHELRERPVLIDSDDPQILADMPLAQPALLAMPAVHVHFRADEVPRLDRRDLVSPALHSAAKLMSQRHRRLDASLRPAVPTVNVQIRAANRSGLHAHQHVGWPERRHRHRVHLQAPGGLHLAQRFHCRGHLGALLLNAQVSDASTSVEGETFPRCSDTHVLNPITCAPTLFLRPEQFASWRGCCLPVLTIALPCSHSERSDRPVLALSGRSDLVPLSRDLVGKSLSSLFVTAHFTSASRIETKKCAVPASPGSRNRNSATELKNRPSADTLVIGERPFRLIYELVGGCRSREFHRVLSVLLVMRRGAGSRG